MGRFLPRIDNFEEDPPFGLHRVLDAVKELDKFEIMWADAILILLISICTAFLGEGLTWLLVYRTEKYRFLKQDIERQTKKLEKKKEEKKKKKKISFPKQKKKKKKKKKSNRDLMMVKMKS